MNKMKAVVLTEADVAPQVIEMEIPKPGPGEVLVKMHSSPINPSDLTFLQGDYGIEKQYPAVPGFEGSGTVVDAGKGILPALWKGKNVACAASPKYNGCWAEYMVTAAGMCVPVSKKITMEQASMMFVNPMTALAFFEIYKNTPHLKQKKRAIINTAAASALGRMIIQLGKKYHVPVISIVRRKEQVEILEAEGAVLVLNSSDNDFACQLNELSHQLNATLIFDAVGGDLIKVILAEAPKQSQLYIYGRLSPDVCEIDPSDLIFTGNQIHGFWLTNYLHEKSFFHALKTTRKIQALIGAELKTHVNKTFPIEQVSEAIETYKNNRSYGKVLIQF